MSPQNQSYLKRWDEYSAKRPRWHAILCPIYIDFDDDGKIMRRRMPAPDVREIQKHHAKEIPDIMRTHPEFYENPDHIFDDYFIFFGPNDTGETIAEPSPLDLKTDRPVWYLFYLEKEAWKFSEHVQFSTENDRDDIFRNYRTICTLNDRNGLLVENLCRSTPADLKYNLHFTIYQDPPASQNQSQSEPPKPMETHIIIDPGGGNQGTGFPPDPGSGDGGTLPI